MEKEVILPKPVLIEDLGLRYETEQRKERKRWGKYKCGFCGSEFEARTQHIKSNLTKSCGCYKKRRAIETHKTHGLGYTRLYGTWVNMKDRVFNIKNKWYSDYGGRGITICEEWLDIHNFYDWAMSNGYSDELSIDRIDNDGNYEPNNCRWTTRVMQGRNRRIQKNNTSGYKGVSYCRKYKKYQAYIRINKKRISLGYYKTAVEGAIAYNNYIIENNLEGFILNEIPEEYQQKISTIKFKGKSSL